MTTPTNKDLAQRIDDLQDSYDSLKANHNRLNAFVFQYLMATGASIDLVEEVLDRAEIARKTDAFETLYQQVND